MEMLWDRFGALAAVAYSSIKLTRHAPERELSMDLHVASAVLEFADDLRAGWMLRRNVCACSSHLLLPCVNRPRHGNVRGPASVVCQGGEFIQFQTGGVDLRPEIVLVDHSAKIDARDPF